MHSTKDVRASTVDADALPIWPSVCIVDLYGQCGTEDRACDNMLLRNIRAASQAGCIAAIRTRFAQGDASHGE